MLLEYDLLFVSYNVSFVTFLPDGSYWSPENHVLTVSNFGTDSDVIKESKGEGMFQTIRDNEKIKF